MRTKRTTELALLTAVGWLVRPVHAVVVAVTHPHTWNTALGDGTLELVGSTGHLGCEGKTGREQTSNTARLSTTGLVLDVSHQPDGASSATREVRGAAHSRQSFSSSPSPQLS